MWGVSAVMRAMLMGEGEVLGRHIYARGVGSLELAELAPAVPCW